MKLNGFKIFIDETVIKSNKLIFLLKNLELPKDNYIIVPYSIITKLNSYNEKKVNSNLRELNKSKKVKIIETNNSISINNLYLSIFNKIESKYKILLITQNKKLVLKLKNTSFKTTIKLMFINNNGELKYWNIENNNNNHKKTADKFKKINKIVKINNEDIITAHIPGLKDYVKTKKIGKLKLIKEIGSGGEGKIYKTNSKYVCKIYNNNNLRKYKFDKIKLMTRKDFFYEGICWPIDIVYNENNDFSGYLMNMAEGKPMQHVMFVKNILEKNFPEWNREDLVVLAINILEKINFLHDKNIIIGDINPLNILIKNSEEVYFVDTDSYQIEGYPCSVGTINFTAPEIQGKNYSNFLRTLEHEYFAVATLIFMILLPGKPPYSKQGGATPEKNIINQNFSYPLGDNSNQKAPMGSWRFIWSNLPYKLKEQLYNVFNNNQRLKTGEWLNSMKEYLKLLKENKVSNELFPKHYKLVDPIKVECSECGKSYKDNKSFIKKLHVEGKENYCPNCFKDKKYLYRKSNKNNNKYKNTSNKNSKKNNNYNSKKAKPKKKRSKLKTVLDSIIFISEIFK